jgi:hypothetical protein
VPVTGVVVTREDWPLLLTAREVLGVPGPDELDPIRIQKGMFLLSMRGPKRDLYRFRPYNWGPFSVDLYGDLDLLVANGMLVAQDQPGRAWARFKPTGEGVARARQVATQVGAPAVSWLGITRQFLTTRGFAKLLSDVYDEFPEYATASLFHR